MSEPRQTDWVAFRIADIYLPGPQETLATISDDTMLMGRVVESSDCGLELDVFSVVELANSQRVIVARDKLHPVSDKLSVLPDNKGHTGQ